MKYYRVRKEAYNWKTGDYIFPHELYTIKEGRKKTLDNSVLRYCRSA